MLSTDSTVESSRDVVMMTWLGVADPGTAQHVASGGVADDDGEAVVVGVLDRTRVGVDDDDLVAVLPVVHEGVDRAAALGAVADDHHVLVHLAPPSGDPELLPALGRQDLERRADQQDQEGDAQRRDDEGVDQPRARRVTGAMSP